MRTSDFDYELPADRIAQQPVRQRSHARLLVLDRRTGGRRHHRVLDLPELLAPGDLLVFNDTRVRRARLIGRKETGGRLEVLLLEPTGSSTATEETWLALLGASRTPGSGTRFSLKEGLEGEVLEEREEGMFLIRLRAENRLTERRDLAGDLPLPPYIRRPEGSTAEDRERYQTVFATREGAVAAPTAGLHFTTELLEDLRAQGVDSTFLTLDVGIGTFRPVKVSDPANHEMHAESYTLSKSTIEAVEEARRRGGRVIAVGTTTVRVLESCARADGTLQGGSGRTELFILPGFEFRVVDAMLTNFHLPRSTLLMMVSAFAGRQSVLDAYREAVRKEYRFYSYGDAMLIL